MGVEPVNARRDWGGGEDGAPTVSTPSLMLESRPCPLNTAGAGLSSVPPPLGAQEGHGASPSKPHRWGSWLGVGAGLGAGWGPAGDCCSDSRAPRVQGPEQARGQLTGDHLACTPAGPAGQQHGVSQAP